MTTANDTTTTLNPGAGGDSMDESNVLEPTFSTGAAPTSVGKRPRVVIGGEQGRAVVVEPIMDTEGYALPTVDVEARKMLGQILECDERIAELLEAFVAAALRRP